MQSRKNRKNTQTVQWSRKSLSKTQKIQQIQATWIPHQSGYHKETLLGLAQTRASIKQSTRMYLNSRANLSKCRERYSVQERNQGSNSIEIGTAKMYWQAKKNHMMRCSDAMARTQRANLPQGMYSQVELRLYQVLLIKAVLRTLITWQRIILKNDIRFQELIIIVLQLPKRSKQTA